MATKEQSTDIVQDAYVVRNLLTRAEREDAPAKAQKAAESLRKALEAVAEKREALVSALETSEQ